MQDPEETSKTKKVHPIEDSCFLTNLFFCWTFKTFWKGWKKQLSDDDLYQPLQCHKANVLGDKLEGAWEEEKRLYRNPSLWRTLWRAFGFHFCAFGLVTIILECIIKLSQPILVGNLLSNNFSEAPEKTYQWATLIIVTTFLNVLFAHSYLFGLQQLGMKVRIGLSSLIYRKSLKLSKNSTISSGKTVNILSNDASRFNLTPQHLHYVWIAPVQTVLVIVLLYITVGITAVVGIVLLLFFGFVQWFLGKRVFVYRSRTAVQTDRRIQLMKEIINGIQIIKMYTLEKHFIKLIGQVRNLEIGQIRLASYIRALNVSFMLFMNRTGIFLCILTHVLTSHSLTAKYVFVVTAFYAVLRQALTVYFPFGLTHLMEIRVSVNRIQEFLLDDEVVSNREMSVYMARSDDNGRLAKQSAEPFEEKVTKVGIHLQNVSVKWRTAPGEALSNVSIDVWEGQLVAAVGAVGSGKSSLLHVILKELPATSGAVSVNGSVSYASQEPWLFSASVRQNILLGQPMTDKKYKEVLKVCALELDLGTFPNGDLTPIGDRGVLLSGGQRARVNLARCLYRDADIYLLDDPFSTVDAQVAKQLMNDAILGYLKGKTVILVTHHLQYLSRTDKVYFFENGKIATFGNYDELEKNFKGFIEDSQRAEQKAEEAAKPNIENYGEKCNAVKEQRGSGSIAQRAYTQYLTAGGSCLGVVMLLMLFILAQIGASGIDYFTAFWVNQEQAKVENQSNYLTTNECISVYVFITCFSIVIILIRSLKFFNFCMHASKVLYNNMFFALLKVPISFFQENNSGRILNRFSKDIASVDETIPIIMMDTIQITFAVLGIVTVVAILNPWILLPTIFILFIFYFFRIVFLSSSNNIKRMEATTKSPIYSHFNASLQGLTTIRAHKVEQMLCKEFDYFQDLHSSAYSMFLGCSRAFGFWLDFGCVLYAALVTISIFFITQETFHGNVGLAITQAISLTGLVQWGFRQWSELENQMISVERVLEYTDLEPEPNSTSDTNEPLKPWPCKGQIEFQSVHLKYGDNPVLKNLSFTVKPFEKIGIIGRTGAGKTSISTALFRLANFQGNIFIDNVNIKEVSLEKLRTNITAIPQEPMLFSGTLRSNLDPLDHFSDEKLWNVLELVEMKDFVGSQTHGLHFDVGEGGSNISVGQKQLICLARAMVRKSKIFIFDEATANIDHKTDELIQKAVKKYFNQSTALIIAHRLQTVVHCDRIFVMEGGLLVQSGPPNTILHSNA